MKSIALLAAVFTLVATHVVLTVLSHDLRQSFDGMLFVVVATFALVGFVITRRAPANSIGWLLMGASFMFALGGVAGAYAVLDFLHHGGNWRLGHLAIVGQPSWTLGMVFVGLAVSLFPGGVPSSPRWRVALRVYLAFGLWFYCLYTFAQIVLHVTPNIEVNSVGDYTGPERGLANVTSAAAWVVTPVIVGFWIAFIVHQARAWRAAHGERREQIKWLMCCGAVTVVSIVVVVFTNGSSSLRLVTDVAAIGIAALPLGIGVGILKYRLYEIDRLVSRTISYLLLTGLLAGIFAGVVVLATDVLPFSSPVGVAASTLAAAALFNPLRRRLRDLVDRRFNRARYDAEATMAAFARRLREAVDPDAVEVSLTDTLATAVEPAHVSVWIRQPG
jgi:hypothetical protein